MAGYTRQWKTQKSDKESKEVQEKFDTIKKEWMENGAGALYDKFFTVKSKVNFYEEEFSITYIDLLIKNISIKELN